MDKREALMLSEAEALELYRFTKHDYISIRDYPELTRLIARISAYLHAKAKVA